VHQYRLSVNVDVWRAVARNRGAAVKAAGKHHRGCRLSRECETLGGVDQQTVPQCACCGFRTGCSTCPICYWTDDGRGEQHVSAVIGSTNGDLSLADARLNYSIYGASTPRYRDVVRLPRDDERP
jgi:hypothetical protein